MFLQEPSSTNSRKTVHTIGAQIITYTILGFPYYNYKYIGPQNPILIIKAPRLHLRRQNADPCLWASVIEHLNKHTDK